MLREGVINHGTNLKEKIDNLKLSEKDQQIAKYLASCLLVNFLDNFRYSNEGDELEKKLNEVLKKLDSFSPDNDTVNDWGFLALQHARTLLDWINLKKINQSYREELNRPTIEEVD